MQIGRQQPPRNVGQLKNQSKSDQVKKIFQKREKKIVSQQEEVKRCFAFGVGENMKFDLLRDYLLERKEQMWIPDLFAREKIICRLKGDAVIFYIEGSMICWGTTPEQNDELLAESERFFVKRSEELQEEEMEYVERENEENYLREDCLFISMDREQNLRGKLAFSYGLHFSLILAQIEDKYQQLSEHIKTIPDMLSGKAGDFKMHIMALFHLRYNLNFKLLDECPDIFWEEPKLESNFRQISRYFDIRNRIGTLNERLEYYSECVDFIKDILHSEHSFRLEWMIIALIATEIIITLFDKWFC